MNYLTINSSRTVESVEMFGEIEAETHGIVYGSMIFEVKPNCATELHSHSSEEIWLVRTGCGKALIGDEEVGLNAGTRVTVPAHIPHSIVNTSDIGLVVMGFWWRES
jgi:mannose-6-phosphate isomerase-like protein (cupin superfamily)